MSRFIEIPNKEGILSLVNVDNIIRIKEMKDGTYLYLHANATFGTNISYNDIKKLVLDAVVSSSN